MTIFGLSLADFKMLAESIQALVLTLAAVGGGLWALFRFQKLGELESARISLEVQTANLRKTTNDLKERGTINISLFVESIDEPKTKATYLIVRATVTNLGNRVELLDWDGSYVNTAHVLGSKDGSAEFGTWSQTKPTKHPERKLLAPLGPGEIMSIVFTVSDIVPGLYYVAVYVPASEKSMDEFVRDFVGTKGHASWEAYAVVRVPTTGRGDLNLFEKFVARFKE